MRTRAFLITLLWVALPPVSRAGTASAPRGPGTPHGLLALVIDGMVSAPPGQAWEASRGNLSRLHELMEVRGPEGNLDPEALDKSIGVRSALEPFLAALGRLSPEHSGPFEPAQVAAALPLAAEAVRREASALEAAGGDLASVEANLRRAWHLTAYHSAYLGKDETLLADVRQRLSRKEARLRREGARGRSEAAEARISEARDWSPGQDEEPVAADEAGEGRRLGLSPAPQDPAELESARREYLARELGAVDGMRASYFELDPAGALASRYPLAATRERYAEALEAALEANEPAQFWRLVDAAFSDLETRVEEILGLLPRTVFPLGLRLELLAKLALQANDLHDDVRAMYAAKDPRNGRFKLSRRNDRSDPAGARFKRLVEAIRAADPAHWTRELHDAREGESTWDALRAFERLAGAWKAWVDLAPGTRRSEVVRELADGVESPWMMGLREAHWNGRKLGGPGGALERIFNRGLVAGLLAAVAAVLGWALTFPSQPWAPWAAAALFSASAAAVVVSFLNLRRSWRLRGLRRWLERRAAESRAG